MQQQIKEVFLRSFPAIKFDEPLANYCNFRIGGPADLFYLLKDIDEIPALLRMARKFKLPFYIFGRGTNILFADAGFRGLIIANHSKGIELDGGLVRVSSGVTLSDIIAFGVRNGLAGLEPVFCLPGTIGGAVFGNAGSFGLETKDFLRKVEFYDVTADKVRVLEREGIDYSYRSSDFKKNHPKWVIMRVWIKMERLLPDAENLGGQVLNEAQRHLLAEVQKKLRAISELRKAKQPHGSTCGSYFKNLHLADGKILYAGKMIEECGLKGFRIGGAQISEKHGNFLLNVGGAKAADVLNLADLIKAKVKERFAVELEEEVRVVGAFC